MKIGYQGSSDEGFGFQNQEDYDEPLSMMDS